MKCEVPELARCCLCFPLRYGLLVSAYLKLIFLGLTLFTFIETIVRAIVLTQVHKEELPIFIMIFLIAIFSCVDLVFHIIFIISAHKKNTTKMRLFYKEILFGLIFYIFCFIYIIAIFISHYSIIRLFMEEEVWCFFMIIILSQGYLIVLVRSEVQKLENNSKFQFTNRTITAEEQCTKIDENIIV